MEFRRSGLSIEEAKGIDIVSYLATLGHQPSKIRYSAYWYLSPLRNEKTPSFKVDRTLNRWYDHGLGKGGNFIDFAILYHNITVGDLLRSLGTDLSFPKDPILLMPSARTDNNKLTVLEEYKLRSPALMNYLRQRRLSVEVADIYCKEVSYQIAERAYYGIGFKNDLGGWEIRNAYFKGSCSPKGITTYDNGSNEVLVFEGFIDFLSFKAVHQTEPEDRFNFVVLNSVSFFERARPFMEKHRSIKLYLDRDITGQNCSRYATSIDGKYSDESNLYRNHKDFNDWIMNFGRCQGKLK